MSGQTGSISASTSNSGPMSSGILELARPHLTTLANEIDAGRTRRLISAAKFLADTPDAYADWDVHEAAYELRCEVSAHVGHALADEDEEESMHGIPAFESFLVLSLAYGSDWVRQAYADYLSHFSDVVCREPYAVASAVVARAEVSYAELNKKAA